MEILGAFLGPVVEYTLSPVRRELGYLFFYKRNVKDLEKQLGNLQLVRERVQILVNEEKSNSHEIFNEVLTWLAKVDAELQLRINEGGSNRNNVDSYNLSCLNKLVQCQPRKTKKRVEHVLELIDDGKAFDKDNVGYSAPLPNTKCPTLPLDYQILESRTLMAEQIKNALAYPSVNRVGVSGMGGVGKTKLLDEVKKLVLESNLFDRVIVVTVGTSKDVKRIQDEIGGMLNMKLDANSEEVRASLIHTMIVEMKDNVLIMLDDLWKEYDLEKDFGIPCIISRKEGCKVVITSRSRDLLTNQFNTEKWFEVNSLSEQESWKFFVAIVGEFVEVGIEHLAKNVVKECGGLPLALKSLAKALKGKKIQVWKDALKKLKNHVFVGISKDDQKLYNCLKLSFDSIEDEEAKLLFLLCSVFPDDHQIPVIDLQMYVMGMGMLNDINQWEDVRNRVMKLVDDLTSSYLLIDCNVDHVQMHDVVRDVAKYIASRIYKMPSLTYGCAQSEWQEEDRYGSYNAIFVDCKDFSNLPSNLEFPNLRLLILRKSWSWKDTQIPDAFFEGMENLGVLDMNMTNVFLETLRTSLIHSLKNLQTLRLSNCECYDIDTIGELKKLKILIINDCKIKELPVTMSQLTELKVLEVWSCFKLEVIHPNIISSMTKLEELSLLWSFRRWGEEVLYKEKTIKNVKLSDLNCLTQLSILRIEIPNFDILSNELSLERVQKLQDFYICVGVEPQPFDIGYIRTLRLETYLQPHYRRYTRLLKLIVKSKMISIGGVLDILLQECEELHVVDSMGSTTTLFKPNANYGLKHLWIHLEDSDVEHISSLFDVQVSFSDLKDLTINRGNNLEMLWRHSSWITANSFCKLQKLDMAYCHKLKSVFPFNMVKSLPFLKILEIKNCELLERIFEIEESTDDAKVVPLTILKLSHLPNLKYVWNSDPGERLTFPNLNEVNVFDCPQLGSLFPASFIKHMEGIETLHVNGENDIFAEEEASKLMVLFPSLRSLKIHCKKVGKGSFWRRSESFPKLRSLNLIGSKDDGMFTLPTEMSELLYRIEEFEICDAFELVQVFQNGEENNHSQGRSKLKTLCLAGLPNLIHVWKDYTEMTKSFDSLDTIVVYDCMKLKCLLPLSITFSNLTNLEVEKCNGMMNVFCSSVAKKLVNLRTMSILRCEGMNSIIEGEGEEEISFNRMKDLNLSDLPRLTSFHSGKSKLKFPCLDKLRIEKCPEMKTFSYEISMPKLQGMTFSSEKDGEIVRELSAKGVNVGVQDLWMNDIVRSLKNLFTQEVEASEEG